MLRRPQALALLQSHLTEAALLHHSLETEAVLRALAQRLGQDQELWGLAGLLHDLDWTATKESPETHGLASAQLLADHLPEVALAAIRAHNGERNGHAPTTPLDYALRCGESVTGLVRASALLRPEGLQGMRAASLKKKMKDKAFARNVSRENIRECERLGLELGDFLTLAIGAVSGVAAEVGLA